MQPSEQPGSRPSNGTKPARPAAQTLDLALDQGAKEARSQRALRCLFPHLERVCPPSVSRFWAIGGRPGNFKTQLMWNMALNMAQSHHRVLFVSLEMTPGEISLQAAARYSGLPTERIVAGLREHNRLPFGGDELGKWDEATKRLMEMVMFLRVHGADEHGREIREIMATATAHCYDAVFVDHLGMIGRDSQGNELDKLKDATHALRALSRGEINARCRPFVCASTPLNRDIEKGDEDEPRAPRLADFRGSSRIEHDTDVSIILQKRKQAEGDGLSIVDAFVLKNRQGRCPLVLQFEANGACCLVTERRKPEEQRKHWQDKEGDE